MKKYIIGVVVIIVVLLLGINYNLKNDKVLKETEGLISVQSKLEKEIKTSGFTIDDPNIILNPYEISPLSALIIFETDEEVSPVITVLGKDKHSTFEHKFERGKNHILPVYGLYGGYNNKVEISIDKKVYEFNIKTEKLPKDIIKPTKVTSKKSMMSNDLYFFTPSSDARTIAYDVNGDIRWFLNIDAVWDISRLANGNLLLSNERPINPPYFTTGLYEMNLLGKIYNEFTLPGGYHHDYYEMENGNLLVASNEFENNTVEDIIVEVDRTNGEIVKTYDLKDILNVNDGKSENWSDYDWFHNNSVWYDKKTNSITLSGRHQDAVINIDYDTGDLNWIIGDSTNWSEEYQKYFFEPVGELEWQWSQHAAMITPEGHVFLLDNGNNKSKIESEYIPANKSYTRGVIYDINTDDMTIKQLWQYGKERGSDFYSPYISDVDYLGKDHYIVHSGGIVSVDGKPYNSPAGFAKDKTKLNSITTEIKNDEVIFEIQIPSNYYRTEKMPIYTKNDNFVIKDSMQHGSLNKTEYKYKMYNLLNNEDIEKIEEEKEISIVNEYDRLVFTGRFLKDDKVEVILNKNLLNKSYDVRVSKKPYTALCIDIFTEDENENGILVNKYINKKGLRGSYNVYLKINGTIYNTNKKIKV